MSCVATSNLRDSRARSESAGSRKQKVSQIRVLTALLSVAGLIGGTSAEESCPIGSYITTIVNSSATSCKLCPAGHYSDQPGAADCSACPVGRTSLPGTSSADYCCAAGMQLTKKPPGYTYVGCFNDPNSARDLVIHPESATQLAHLFLNEEEPYTEARVMLCANACRSEGWAYMGLQWSAECWCGNTYGSQGELDISSCDSTGDVNDAAGTDGLTGVADLCGMSDVATTCSNTNAVYSLAFTVNIGFCSACTQGTYDHDADATSPCESCPSNTYQNQPGSSDCTTCSSGRTSVPGSTSADACCPIGFVGNHTSCSPCVAPYYDLDQSAVTPCAPCSGETFRLLV